MALWQGETEQALPASDGKNVVVVDEGRGLSQRRDAVWKKAFFEKVQQRGINLQQKMLEEMKVRKEKEKGAAQDARAMSWLNEDKLTIDTRVYLLEKLMPTLISGIEKLSMEVEKRNLLAEDVGQSQFNPINFLGQYLMKNNPRADVRTEPSPYERGMKQVLQSLSSKTAKEKLSRLSQLKTEMKETREWREEVEKIQAEEQNKRKEAVALQLEEWTLDSTGRIPLPLIESALMSFQEVISQSLQEREQVTYARELEVTDNWETKLNREEVGEYLYSYIKDLSTEVLEEFLRHLSQCASGFRETIRRDVWRRMFSHLFQACDSGQVGFLDRQRILALLENFYDSHSEDADGWRFRDPRQWPVIDLEDENQPDSSAQPDSEKDVKEEMEDDRAHSSLKEQEDWASLEDLDGDGLDALGFAMSNPEEMGSSEEEEGTEGDSRSNMRFIKEWQGADGEVWSGALLTSDLALKCNTYEQRSQQEWNIASKFRDLQPLITDLDSQRPSRAASAFSRSTLTRPQFMQLMETFVGEEASLPAVQKLVAYIRKQYEKTEEELLRTKAKVRNETLFARRMLVLTALFQKLDNEGSGFVDLNELEGQLLRYKEGAEKDVILKGREKLTFPPDQSKEPKLSAKTFQFYIECIVSKLPGNRERVFEKVVEFLTLSMERSQAERLRGSARRKWLQHIQRAAENSAGSLEPVYRAVFLALSKDAEAHGNNKRISASIALLEKDPLEGDQAEIWLRYVACTSDDAPYVLNKILYRHMKGVSFSAIDEGKPVHAPRVQYHGNIHFWNQDRPAEERKGSLLVLPLQDATQRTFGTLTIDTMRDPHERNIFMTHEISFYQGICNVFSTAYHHVRSRQNILKLVASALAWIYNRAPNIHTVITYMMEPSPEKTEDYILRKMMTTDNSTGMYEMHSTPAILRRKDNLFRDYLFKCADSSEPTTTDAYGERHIVVPIREPMGRALGVIDISTGQCRELPAHELQDLQKMLQMLQAACSGILEESSGETQRTFVLEAEHIGENKRVDVLFHRFMLQDLRECVQKLDQQSFAELKSYKKPPALVHDILKAVLLLFCPDWADSEEIESWSQCKLKVNGDLIRKISCFDPTARSVHVQPELLAKYIKGIQRGAVWRHGSIPAEYLYNWAFTCLSLMELTAQLRGTQQEALISFLPQCELEPSSHLEEQTSSNEDVSSY
ncbi:EF-hand calcium-binding domain-containing protein 5 [Rhinatrema bivittatum]|uniref:EF-hand calcium-binding domain-containing protein 5 n=1 Tax=Rhinatrema bivittatum TaxID=194408 RepID=UPI00112B2684|nr:EF-hand calcium-binding domain-containing protein 5 [Rhinatrema bivittatum]XP_029469320.1 EF-hand calcium-binding domain-containing protein 5 [Rhinatrema bivittatum]